MDKLNNWLHTLNLLFTNTCDRDTFYEEDYDYSMETIDTEENISLYDLIQFINRIYLSFIKDYNKIKKTELGQYVEIQYFKKDDKKLERSLSVYVDKPTFTDYNETYLTLKDKNGHYESFISSHSYVRFFDKNYYCKKIKLNQDIIKEYLDLFEKYILFFELLYHLRNNVVFCDGTNMLYSTITYDYSQFPYDLKNIRISLLSEYLLDEGERAIIVVNLGKNMRLDYSKCSLKLDGKDVLIDEEEFINILKNTYINGVYLSDKKEQKKDRIVSKIKNLK